MPSSRAHATVPARRRPLLLGLVFGVLLVLVGITASAQTAIVTAHFSSSALAKTVDLDRTLIRLFVEGNLTPADLGIDTSSPTRIDALTRQLRAFVERGQILRVELRDPAGRVVLSDQPALRGTGTPTTDELTAAIGGRISAAVLNGTATHHAGGAPLGPPSILEEWIPLVAADGSVQAIFVIWRDAATMLAGLETVRNQLLLVFLGAALVLALVLLTIFRAAQSRIARQTDELMESTRRDALTGLLNHGAVVAFVAERVEAARDRGESVELALVDIDNFSLLNDTYDHVAGDHALRELAICLETRAPAGTVIGRYGPDEFLLVGPPGGADPLRDTIERVRSDLDELALQFGDSERLPITISCGISRYPDDGQAVTELLAAAAIAQRSAKLGGGDRISDAEPSSVDQPAVSAFDVLQGLVIAVDTKDRYTKRHSEDVARYAIFLADQLDVGPALRRTLHVAGLLHDVGKIGIPDAILRKPGRLTSAELAVVQQHVRLGDMIVRDLPDIEDVRAGIRYHHERWDGDGYLDRLEGDEIPLIARILAVADSFSAMTTSRPYRKSMGVDEALKRLGDAAGSQLDETLVRAFITGIETASDPPLPGIVPPPLLWAPLERVA
jgi:diguanylate cyclase (GGDEF)-like protein